MMATAPTVPTVGGSRNQWGDYLNEIVANLIARVIDPRDYGAVGDGVTDDTAALQRAADAMPGAAGSSGGATLDLGYGSYLVSDTITVTMPGARVVSSAAYGGFLRPDAAMTGPVLHFVDDGYVLRGPQIENVVISMGTSDADGILIESPYDQASIRSVFITGCSGSYGIKIMKNAATSTGVGQTLIAENCWVEGDTGWTGTAWDIDRLQEAVFIGCKGLAGGNGSGTAWRIANSRSITMLTCSYANADKGCEVVADARTTTGITLISPLFEDVTQGLNADGTSTYNITRLSMTNPRWETAAPTVTLDYVTLADLDTDNYTTTVNATCSQVVIRTRDITKVTDSGANSTVIEYKNAVNSGYRVGPHLVVGTGSTTYLRTGVPAANEAAAYLLVNDGTTTSLRRVTVGAADSAGAGYRTLRVAN